MIYSDHYFRLIGRAKGRDLLGYKERHHILPRCIGGNNAEQNIVNLTPEEHFVAHCLLVKMYPKHYGIASAANLMAAQRYNNKSYGWIRRHWALAKTGTKQKVETKQKIANALKGRRFDPEHKKKISESLKKHNRTALHGKNISAALKGKKPSIETRKKMSLAGAGKTKSPEHIANVVIGLKAYHARKKQSESECA